MKLRALVLASALIVVPASAFADPITAGGLWQNSRTPLTEPGSGGLEVSPFWANASWDGPDCNVGDILNALVGYDLEGLEYLHDGFGSSTAFRFELGSISVPVFVSQLTAWTNGVLQIRDDGAFTYDSGTGRVSNSWESGEQYALFRIVGSESTRYFLGVEDILLSETMNDRDYNDRIVTFTESHSVPEPSTLLLMGLAMGVAGARRFRGGRAQAPA
jgi:hypothetical protein